MSFSFFNSFNGNSNRLGQNYAIQSYDVAEPKAITFISSDVSSITFSFTPPTTSGTISGYRFSVNGQPVTGTGGPSAYTISGLSAGQQYSINMVANIVSSSTTITTTSVTFAPTSVTGCSLWLDAADTATITYSSGSNVSQWSDKSGLGNNATQSTSTSQPISGSVSTNGKNVLNFTGKSMIYPTINNTTITVFCIYNNTTFVPYGPPVNVGPFAFFYAAPNSKVGIGRLAVTDEVLASWSSAGLTTSQYVIYGGTVSVSGNTTSFLYFNGTQVATVSVNSSGGTSAYSVGDSINNMTSGNIAEVLIYNSVLSTTDRQKVEGYLAWKWGLQTSLPGAHPYYGAAPSGGTSTVTTTTTKNIVSNPSRLLTNTTLAPFPTNIQFISATTTSLTFSFTAPTTGSTPSGYTPYVNGSAATGSGTPSSYTISGLSGGTNYSVTMGANVSTMVAGTFNPTTISGCLLWLDAADSASIVFSGSNVTQWNDKSNSGYNFTQGTTASQPTYSAMANGKSAVNFTISSTPKYMTNTSVAFPTNYTIFAVGYNSQTIFARLLTSIPDSYLFFGSGNGVTQFTTFVGNGTAWNDTTTNATATTVTSLCLMEMTNNNTSTGLIPYINGTAQTAKNGTTATFNGLNIGWQTSASTNQQYWNGYIAEILVYNSVLTTTQRQQVEGYLANKWAIQSSLPAAHPYYSDAPTSLVAGTTIYQNPTPVSLRTASAPVTYTYQYTGSNQSVVVPTGTTYMVAELWGAGGGGSGNGSNSAVYNVISGSGGGGGYTSANLTVSAGTTLTIIVGQAGNVSAIGGQAVATYGGGGGCITLNGDNNWRNTSGGGRSAIQISGVDIITAGGGGGGGHIAPSAPNPATGTYMTGGAGGGLIGGTGGFGDSSGTEQNGKGGTQSAGGAAGSNKPGGNPSTNGTAGSQYQGGTGTSSGAGGGGGWYGGGGSNFSYLLTYYLGSGGGGSSYVSSSYLKSGTTATLTQASGATVAANSSLPAGVQGTIGGGGAGSTTGSAGQNGYAVITFYFT